MARTTWHPTKGGKRSWVCFDDHIEVEVGSDDGDSFEQIGERMMSGDYYPVDAVQFFGDFREERRVLRAGDRVIQRASLPLRAGLWSEAEVFVAERDSEHCRIGYVTTDKHFGRGIWQAELRRRQGRLLLCIVSTVSPGSWPFWVGLPLARFLQLRARRRGIEECRRVAQASG